jgi:ribonuclease J
VVDCGTSFPHDDIGIDVVHPNFTWLVQQRERLVGVFLTHGHEDHIGAVPYLLRKVTVPIWGPRHALELTRRRLREHGYRPDQVDFFEARPRVAYDVGPFRIEPVRVAHSIIEACALSIDTCVGRVFHTGDFNLDPQPPDGEPTDEERIRALGDAGVRLLLSDSTNIDVPDRRGSEREAGLALERLISAATGRVVVSMFASNVQRLISIGEIALAHGRRICPLGRSLEKHVGIARELGWLRWPSDLLLSPDQLEKTPHERVLVLAGGTQGERWSTLRRLGSRTHRYLTLAEGDTVVHSARIIPGNEREVLDLFCDLMRQGVDLHTRFTEPDVHSSGHACRSEQRSMIEWLRPRSFLPVHGTLHHLRKHAQLARETGVEDTLVVENGEVVVVNAEGPLRREAGVEHGRVSVAFGGTVLDQETAHRRLDLGRNGVVVVALAVDEEGRRLAAPGVRALGVPGLDDDERAVASLERALDEALFGDRRARRQDREREARRVVRRAVFDASGVKPNVVVQVVRP